MISLSRTSWSSTRLLELSLNDEGREGLEICFLLDQLLMKLINDVVIVERGVDRLLEQRWLHRCISQSWEKWRSSSLSRAVWIWLKRWLMLECLSKQRWSSKSITWSTWVIIFTAGDELVIIISHRWSSRVDDDLIISVMMIALIIIERWRVTQST